MIGIDQPKTIISYALLLLHDKKFHGTFHTCMNSYVEDLIRVSNQTRLKKYVYVKIPWMILHNDTRIKSYTYEKLHVWKVTRIEYWALIGALLYAYRLFHGTFDTCLRFIHVTFYTCNLWRILSTSANHKEEAVPIKTIWGQVAHVCVNRLATIGPDNSLLPGRRQAIIWTNVKMLLIRTLGKNFSEILCEIHSFSFKKMHLKMSSAKYLGLSVLKDAALPVCRFPL